MIVAITALFILAMLLIIRAIMNDNKAREEKRLIDYLKRSTDRPTERVVIHRKPYPQKFYKTPGHGHRASVKTLSDDPAIWASQDADKPTNSESK